VVERTEDELEVVVSLASGGQNESMTQQKLEKLKKYGTRKNVILIENARE
jgi:hypothetical protein